MKKGFLKVICTLLCALMLSMSFMACGGETGNEDDGYEFDNSSSAIQITIQNAGYGYKWLKDAMKLYTQETGVTFAEPKVNVIYGHTNTSALNHKNNDTDLYFDIQENTVFYQNLSKAKGLSDGKSDTFYVDITDVYESEAKGYGDSNLKIKDLVTDITYENYTWTDNKQYAFSWARGVEGIVYNKDYFTNNNFDIPKTTDELIELCKDIKALPANANGKKQPYAISWSDGYWGQCSMVWTFQYEGLDAYNKYCEGKNADGIYSPDIYKMQGKEYAYDIINTLIDHDNGYTSTACAGYSFTQNQSKFLLGESFMMPNGDWLEREMKANFEGDISNIEVMKMPVNSKIIEKLSTVNSDAELIKVIDYVDGVSTQKPTGVSDEDIAYVRQARNMLFTQQLIHYGYIPFYSDKIDEVKDFIKFLYRKDVQLLIAKGSYGNMFPTKYDFSNETGYSSFSSIKKSCDAVFNKDTVFLSCTGKHKLYYLGGCVHSWGGQTSMGLDHTSGSYMTAKNVLNYTYDLYKDSFSGWMTSAGVSN